MVPAETVRLLRVLHRSTAALLVMLMAISEVHARVPPMIAAAAAHVLTLRRALALRVRSAAVRLVAAPMVEAVLVEARLVVATLVVAAVAVASVEGDRLVIYNACFLMHNS